MAALCPASALAQDAEIAEIRAHLFYEYSGALSENILDPAREQEFVGWNAIIAGGDAREPTDNLLVDVVIRTEGHQYLDEELEVRVTDADGNELASRTFHGLLTSDEGTVHSPVWVEDVGCAGTVTIHASFRNRLQQAELHFLCGE